MKVVLPLPAMPTQTIATGSSEDEEAGEEVEDAMVVREWWLSCG